MFRLLFPITNSTRCWRDPLTYVQLEGSHRDIRTFCSTPPNNEASKSLIREALISLSNLDRKSLIIPLWRRWRWRHTRCWWRSPARLRCLLPFRPPLLVIPFSNAVPVHCPPSDWHLCGMGVCWCVCADLEQLPTNKPLVYTFIGEMRNGSIRSVEQSSRQSLISSVQSEKDFSASQLFLEGCFCRFVVEP